MTTHSRTRNGQSTGGVAIYPRNSVDTVGTTNPYAIDTVVKADA